MKKILLISIPITIILIISLLGISALQTHKLIIQKNCIIVSTNNEHITIFTKNNPKKMDGFEIVKQLMNDCGYTYNPDKQLGLLHFFNDSEGRNLECDVDYYNFFTKSELHFDEDMGFTYDMMIEFVENLGKTNDD